MADDKGVLLQVAEAIQEAAEHWDGDYRETIDLPEALEHAEKIMALIGWPFSCDRCGKTLDKPGALAFSDPLPHIDSEGWADMIVLPEALAVKKHHICADCYRAIARADFMPIMTGYEIEEALLAGKQIEVWFPMVYDEGRQQGRWVAQDAYDHAENSGWLMAMLKAGHRGAAIVARVVD